MKKTKLIHIFLGLIVILLFLKSDYRIINELRCCQDDYDYYAHSLTIVEDFDFDYSNQIESKNRFYQNGKVAPYGFIGSGLLASPFLLLGIIFDNVFGVNQEILTYNKLFYSFSSVFYLLFSLYLIKKMINQRIEINTLSLAFFGSGVAYFAFERYSMTHVYEVFTVSLILHLTNKYYKQDKSEWKYSVLLPFAFLLAFLVRWNNYYIILLPYIIHQLTFKSKSKKKIKKDHIFLLSSLTSLGIFAWLSKAIYGVVTFSPTYVYGAQNIGREVSSEIKTNFGEVLFEFFKDTINVLITQEFGILWFSPVIFLGLLLSVYGLISKKYKEKFVYLAILICYAQNLFIISLWNGTASSYGYRYLYSLIPLSIYIISNFKGVKNYELFIKYLKYFSIFSLLSILFFETTIGTQLSLSPVPNSFGVEKIYSQPEYLVGFIKSLAAKESYLKIFATSLLGAIIFKAMLLVLGPDLFYQILSKLGLSTENSDFNDLIVKVEIINTGKFVAIAIFSILFIMFYLKKVKS